MVITVWLHSRVFMPGSYKPPPREFSWSVSVTSRYDDARFAPSAGRLSASALLRFYVLHCVGLPLGIAVLMAVHFWRVRKDGGISGPL
jgi:quinol-cytochrome oxidoreductase complex cytochrome b subunit